MRATRTICRLLAAAAAAALVLVATAATAADTGANLGLLRPYTDGYVTEREQQLLDDAADGRWDRHSLLSAALVAGGVDDPGQLRRSEARLAGWVADLKRSGQLSGPPRKQAKAVFEFMHRQILTGGYEPDATGVQSAIEKGRFNCVSATVLYQCLASRCGLAVSGLEMPGHAKTRLYIDGEPLDVETTCPTWFQMEGSGLAEEGSGFGVQGSGPSTLNSQPSTLNAPPPPRELSPVELVAMIYYNRGVDLLADGRFAEAAAANAKAILLDPQSDTAHGNLLAVLNNWAIDLGRRGRYRQAADLLAGGLALEPDFGTFKTNYVYVHHRWVEELCRQGRYETAMAQLAAAGRAVPGEPYFRQARTEVYNRWVKSSPHGRVEFDPARFAN